MGNSYTSHSWLLTAQTVQCQMRWWTVTCKECIKNRLCISFKLLPHNIRPGTEGNQDKLQLRQPVSSPSLKTGSSRIQRMVPSWPHRCDRPSLILLTYFCQPIVTGLKRAETNFNVKMSSGFIGPGTGISCGFLVNTTMNHQIQSTEMTNESLKQVIHPGCTNRGCQSSGRAHFVPWRLAFVGPKYRTCFVPSIWRPECYGGSWIFGIFVQPCINLWLVSPTCHWSLVG